MKRMLINTIQCEVENNKEHVTVYINHRWYRRRVHYDENNVPYIVVNNVEYEVN